MGTISSTSGVFDLDTLAPQSITTFNVSATGGSTVFGAWNMASDANFDHYEIWYGPNESDVHNRTGTATKWDDGDDPTLGSVSTLSTIVTGVTPGVTNYFSIFAVDIFLQSTRVDTSAPYRIAIGDESGDFPLDTLEPQGLGNFAVTILTSASIGCTWDAASDTNFSHYEIWFGPNEFDVQNRTGASVEWNDGDDGNLASAGTTSTTITSGFGTGDTLYFSIFAVDDFGTASQDNYGSPLTVFDTTGEQFDGAVVVYSNVTVSFDAYIKIFSTNPNNWFGLLLVYDELTESFDGSSHVGIDTTVNANGSLNVNAIVDRLFNGSVSVHEIAENQFDGSIYLLEIGAASFDGSVSTFSNMTRILHSSFEVEYIVHFNGQFEVATGLTLAFNGSLSVVETIQVEFDGSLETIISRGFDGRVRLRDPYAPYLTNLDPSPNTYGIPVDSTIMLTVADDHSGVDLETVRLILYVGKERHVIFDGRYPGKFSNVSVTGVAAAYTFSFNAAVLAGAFGFPYDTRIYIEIRADDMGGNQFGDTYMVTTARNPLLRTVEHDVSWDTNRDFKYNLEYGLNIPQRDNLAVRGDRLYLVE